MFVTPPPTTFKDWIWAGPGPGLDLGQMIFSTHLGYSLNDIVMIQPSPFRGGIPLPGIVIYRQSPIFPPMTKSLF